jgi:hypothetical protein
MSEVSDCAGLGRGGVSSFPPEAFVDVGPEICLGALISGFRAPFFLKVRLLTVSFILMQDVGTVLALCQFSLWLLREAIN